MKIKAIVILVSLVSALALSSTAYAQSTGGDAYGGVLGQQASGGNGDVSRGADPGSGGNSGSLPFTGLEVGVVLVAGLALLGTGVAVRRVSRSGPAHLS